MRGLSVSSDDMRSMALAEDWKFMLRADSRVAGQPSSRISLFSASSAGAFVTHDREAWGVNKIEVRAVLDWTLSEVPDQVTAGPVASDHFRLPREQFDELIAAAAESRQIGSRLLEEHRENADRLISLWDAWPSFAERGMVRVARLDILNEAALAPARSTGWAVGNDGDAWIFDLPAPTDVRGEVRIEHGIASGLLLQMLVWVKELGFEGWDRLVLRSKLAPA